MMDTGVLAHVLASLQTFRPSGALGLHLASTPVVEPGGSVVATGGYPRLCGSIHVYWTFVGYTTEQNRLTYCFYWRPLPDSNRCCRRERAVSWASRRRGRGVGG